MAWGVLWDFDGTLAGRPGQWAGCLLELLDRRLPGHGLSPADLRPSLQAGFPWHQPERPHPELSHPDAWWARMTSVLAGALRTAGLPGSQAIRLAGEARDQYLRPGAWLVHPDSAAALELVAGAGGRNVVLSNHVPELAALIRSLGLSRHLRAVLSSAVTGYEKPHPEAFRAGLRAVGAPATAWMVGDNPVADLAGAAALGIPGLLVGPDLTPLGAARQILHSGR